MRESLETALKYLEYRESKDHEYIHINEVKDIINMFLICESKNKKLVGLGYQRFDGIKFENSKIHEFFERGFVVIDKTEVK